MLFQLYVHVGDPEVVPRGPILPLPSQTYCMLDISY